MKKILLCVLLAAGAGIVAGCVPKKSPNAAQPIQSRTQPAGTPAAVKPADSGADKVPPQSIRIFTIQSSSHTSPFHGKRVEAVPGIVTGITYAKKTPNGFYMQDAVGDGKPETSDGLYVFCGTHMPPHLKIGDAVRVSGMISEYTPTDRFGAKYLSVTQLLLSDAADVTVTASAQPLPAPIMLQPENLEKPVFESDLNTLAPHVEALDFYESLEGMRIQVARPKVVAAVSDGVYYIAPENASGFSAAGGMMYNSYRSTARLCMQPKRCFPTAEEAGIKNAVPSIGDSYQGDIIGILGYGQGNYHIEPTEPLPALRKHSVKPEQSAIRFNPDYLNLVCYNLENFSVKDIRDKNGNPVYHSSGKTAVQRAEQFAVHFMKDLAAPDVICLIEVQDDDSTEKSDTVSAKKTLALLIEKMYALDASKPYAACSIDPKKNADGGASGANIRCAYLYRTDRIVLVPDSDNNTSNSTYKTAAAITGKGNKMQQNPARIGNGEDFFNRTRKPLVAHFAFKKGINGGKDFFVINNHFSSKQADGKIWGGVQPVERTSEVRRHKQAAAVADFIREVRAVRTDAPIIAVGDYNDFWFSKTVNIIKAAGMINAIEMLPENDRYTYVYDGHSQTLDNILVTDTMNIRYTDILHLNAEFPPRSRLSDHDPVFVQLEW